MERPKVTINEMRAQVFSEARRLGFGEATLWRHWLPKIDIIAKYYRDNEYYFMILLLQESFFR